TTTRFPIAAYYGYDRAHMIYLASEIGTTGSINRIGFYVQSASGHADVPVVIKMKTTTSATLSAATYATASTGATTVYTGTVLASSVVAGTLVTIDLSTPFNYTGDNLEVFVESNYGGSGTEASGARRYRHSAAGAVRYQY